MSWIDSRDCRLESDVAFYPFPIHSVIVLLYTDFWMLIGSCQVAFFDDWREGGASHQIVPTFDCVLQKQRRWELNLREKITCS